MVPVAKRGLLAANTASSGGDERQMKGPHPGDMTWKEKVAAGAGLTIEECAAWLGVDRRLLRNYLEVIPWGRPAACGRVTRVERAG